MATVRTWMKLAVLAPNGVHMISGNTNDKVPVKFLAYFICDHDTALTVPPLPSRHRKLKDPDAD